MTSYPPTVVSVEVFLDGRWIDTNTNQGVFSRDPITIRRGRSTWSTNVEPSQAGFSLDNRDGRWSPDNPTGPYHGKYGRNIPVRIGVDNGDTYLTWNGTDSEDLISTPHHTDFDLGTTDDIDIRVEFLLFADPADITDSGIRHRVAAKWVGTTGWYFSIYNANGVIVSSFVWYDGGGTQRSYTTEGTGAALPLSTQWDITALRFTLDASTGTGAFYTASAIDGSWTQLGDDQTSVGATTISTNTEPLYVGSHPLLTTRMVGQVRAFELYDGIGGTLVAGPDFTATPFEALKTIGGGATSHYSAAARSFVDSTDRVWTLGDGGEIRDTRWRFHGELSSLPVRWDLTGNDAWAPVEAAGITRRLKQGNPQLPSVLRRASLTTASLIQYWPCEEASDANLTLFGAAVGAGPLVINGTPNPANNADFISSSPIPTLGSDTWAATIDPYTNNGDWQVRWLMAIPAAGGPGGGSGVAIITVETTALRWTVYYRTSSGGQLKLDVDDLAGGSVLAGTWTTFNADGKNLRVVLQAENDGADIDWRLETIEVTSTASGGTTGTIASRQVSRAVTLKVNPEGTFTDVAVGQITFQNDATDLSDQIEALNAYSGETAATRVRRLCNENGVELRLHGDPADSVRMGPQRPGSLMDVLGVCAATDLGVLYETREAAAIGYRTGASMTNQTAAATLDYTAGDVMGVPRLDRDDLAFRNDVTVKNWNEATARASITTGNNSTLDPPDGAGSYETSFDVNTDDDARLLDHATARLTLSSVDLPRISELAVGLHMPAVYADATKTEAALTVDLGDLVTVSNLHPNAIDSDLDQIVQGTTERIGHQDHRVALSTTPAQPWNTGIVDTDARYDTAGSTLSAAAAIRATSLTVATTTGPLWTTDVAEFPFDVTADGVRVTVTAISGATSPQTFTVTSTDVVRGLASGATVELADPTLYTL